MTTSADDLFMHPLSTSCVIEEVTDEASIRSAVEAGKAGSHAADDSAAGTLTSSAAVEQQDAGTATSQAEVSNGSEEVVEEQLQRVIAACEQLKQEGNQLYAQEDYDGALQMYWQAIDQAPEDAQERAVYFCNAAACYLKKEDWQLACEQCTQALKLNDSYLKALVRRATALQHLDDLEHALADAQRVKELDPENAWALKTVSQLTPEVQKRQEKMKEEMIGKLKELGNTVLGKFGLSLDNFKAEQDPNTGGYSIKFQQ